jgi:hypothetical protein
MNLFINGAQSFTCGQICTISNGKNICKFFALKSKMINIYKTIVITNSCLFNEFLWKHVRCNVHSIKMYFLGFFCIKILKNCYFLFSSDFN